MILIVYSHSSYQDVLNVCKEQLKLFECPYKVYYFLDKQLQQYDNVILYDDKLSYPERVWNCLNQIEENVVLFQHEDMMLYAKPDYTKLKKYFSIVSKGKAHSIKLIKGGGSEQDFSLTPDLHCILPSHPNMFAVQPTIWDKTKLQNLLKAHFGLTIWEMEAKANKFLIDNTYKMLYSHQQEPRRGMFHYDSSVYPYVATAICKGKWNLSEYKELEQLLKDYNIDWRVRGKI